MTCGVSTASPVLGFTPNSRKFLAAIEGTLYYARLPALLEADTLIPVRLHAAGEMSSFFDGLHTEHAYILDALGVFYCTEAME